MAGARPWYRLHISTYAVMLLAATLLFLLNVPGQYVPYLEIDGQEMPVVQRYEFDFRADEQIEHGWPWSFLAQDIWKKRSATSIEPLSVWSLSDSVRDFRPINLAVDLVVAIVLLVLAGALFEWWRRRRRRLLQFCISDLLIGTAVLGVAAASLVRVRSEFEREQATLAELGWPPFVHRSRGGPSWLRELSGESFPHWFDRVIHFDTRPENLEHTASLVHLRVVNVYFRNDLEYFGDTLFALKPLARVEALKLEGFYPSAVIDNETYYTDSTADAEFALGLRALRSLRRLAGLDVRNSAFGDASAEAAAAFSNLRVLDARGAILGDKGLEHIGKLRLLEELCLGTGRPIEDGISDIGIGHLSRLTRLRRLILDVKEITDEAMVHIGVLIELEHLDLRKTSVKGPGLEHLTRLRNLKTLHLPIDVDAEAVDRLQRQLPETEIGRFLIAPR